MANNPSTSSTPDWLNAVKAEAAALETERIALRTAAPLPRGPEKLDAETLEMRHAEARRLTGLGNDLIDLKRAPEPKKPATQPNYKTEPEPVEASADGVIDRPGYPSRLMLPSTAAMVAAGYAWLLYALPYVPTKFQTWEAMTAVPGTLGLFQVVKWAYRFLSGGYKLTKTQLIQFAPGPLPDPEPIDLTEIATVEVQQSAYEWWQMAGTLKVTFERDARPEIVLGPVSFPKRRQQILQQAIESAREGGVVMGRVAVR